MKLESLIIILFCSTLMISCGSESMQRMDGMDKVDIGAQKEEILVQDLQSKELIQAAKSYSSQRGDTFRLSKRIIKGEEIWVEPLENGRYTNPFKKVDFSIQELRKINDIKSLRAAFGDPYFLYGPLDVAGAVIYQWRVIDPTRETPPIAVEITVILAHPDGPLVYMVLTQFVKIQ